jgi:hypothetical protein
MPVSAFSVIRLPHRVADMLLDRVPVLRKNGVHTIGVQCARVDMEVIRDMLLCAAALYRTRSKWPVELKPTIKVARCYAGRREHANLMNAVKNYSLPFLFISALVVVQFPGAPKKSRRYRPLNAISFLTKRGISVWFEQTNLTARPH